MIAVSPAPTFSETRSTCPYCGAGCGVIIEHDATQITGVRGEGPRMLAFDDARRGIAKRALIADDRLAGALLCMETRAADWLLDLIARGGNTAELREWLFAPLATPPAAGPARGRIVCNCFDVSENEIRANLAAGLDLAALTEKRKCGTNCGSCLPELKRMAAQAEAAAPIDA